MPEGHTIHRLAADQRRDLVGPPLVASSPQGRFADGAARLDGRRMVGVDAHGKHLFQLWDGGEVLHVHLGLYGRFIVLDTPADPPTYQARLRLVAPERTIDLLAPTACELGGPELRERIVARLGPDPLRSDADPDRAWTKITSTSRPIGQVLMDQAVVAGVGNVYRAEVLLMHGLHPLVPGRTIARSTWEAIWADLVRHMRRGVREGRIITVEASDVGARRRADIDASEGRFVYKQDRCRRCGAPVVRFDLAGRWAYCCPVEQPLPPGAQPPVHVPLSPRGGRRGAQPVGSDEDDA